MSSIQETDRMSAESGRDPRKRTTLAELEARIIQRIDLTGMEACRPGESISGEVASALSVLSICILVLDNGFCVVGRSAPLDPSEYFPDAQAQFAYEDCIRQLWPMTAFAKLDVLKDRLGGGLYGG